MLFPSPGIIKPYTSHITALLSDRWESTHTPPLINPITHTPAQTYFSFLSISLSSCRPSGLPTTSAPSGMVGGLQGWLRGVEVKQLLGLELGRSECTGVGLMRREGLARLEVKQTKNKSCIWLSVSNCSLVHLLCLFNYVYYFTKSNGQRYQYKCKVTEM